MLWLGIAGILKDEKGNFLGTARAGKDTVAAHLAREYSMGMYSFAQPLKHAAQFLFGLSHDEIWDESKKEVPIQGWNMTPRHIFQKLGTEVGRHLFDPDLWGNIARKRWHEVRDGKTQERPWMAEETLEASLDLANDFEFVLDRTAHAMLDITDPSQCAWARPTVEHLLTTGIQRIMGLPESECMAAYWEIRQQRPFYETVAYGPNGPLTDKCIGGMITPDVRFENESGIIRNEGGRMMHVERILSPDKVSEYGIKAMKNHASEQGVAIIDDDVVVHNHGSLEALLSQAQRLLDTKQKVAPRAAF